MIMHAVMHLPVAVEKDTTLRLKRSVEATGSFPRSRGFTLVELLGVLAIIAIISAVTLPNIIEIKSTSDATAAGYTISGLLERARTYALANNTYVWVGFFEEDGTQPSQNPPIIGNGGRLVISIVASQDGTRYSDAAINNTLPAVFGANDSSNLVTLIQLSKLVKINNVRLVAVNTDSVTGNIPARPAVASTYQMGEPVGVSPNNSSGAFALHVGDSTGNPTTFTFPLTSPGSGAPQYTFTKIIEFNAQGEASKIAENVFTGPGPQDAMEIALDPTHGSVIDSPYSGANQNKAAIAVQIEGLAGQISVYRP